MLKKSMEFNMGLLNNLCFQTLLVMEKSEMLKSVLTKCV